MVVVQIVRQIDLIGGDLVACGSEFHKAGAFAGARAENTIIVKDGSRDVHAGIRGVVVAPQEFASFGINADHALAEELDVLTHTADFANDDRGVAGQVALRNGALPDCLAVKLIQPNHGGFFAAWRADHDVAVYQDDSA